jgi:two-component system NtrC family response regulator
VPPLRGRREDLPELSQALLEQVCRDNGLAPRRLGESALRAIAQYRWPGNVRELKNVLESAAITRPAAVVEASHLPDAIRGLAQEEETPPASGDLSLEGMERDLLRRTLLRHGGNRTRAARALGIGVRTLQRKIQRYALRLEGRRGRPRLDQKSTDTPSPGASSRSRMPSRRRTPPRATSS